MVDELACRNVVVTLDGVNALCMYVARMDKIGMKLTQNRVIQGRFEAFVLQSYSVLLIQLVFFYLLYLFQ